MNNLQIVVESFKKSTGFKSTPNCHSISYFITQPVKVFLLITVMNKCVQLYNTQQVWQNLCWKNRPFIRTARRLEALTNVFISTDAASPIMHLSALFHIPILFYFALTTVQLYCRVCTNVNNNIFVQLCHTICATLSQHSLASAGFLNVKLNYVNQFCLFKT